MVNLVCKVLLSENPLVTPRNEVPPETGAVVDFWGVVRRTEDGSQISGIEYETHRPMAEHQLRKITEEASAAFDLHQIELHHRLGFVPASEPSLFVRVGSRHRAEAFRAAAWIVEQLKERAPIWKHPRPGLAAASFETPADLSLP
ncbi:MAG TPA: molybdenum cofactor biosynthesis protein MoaE [Chthoniobacterales bacterium]|nr:molybdenum cofactor biosynthesis protein MoaE [Chthoniobacterales bacterium]